MNKIKDECSVIQVGSLVTLKNSLGNWTYIVNGFGVKNGIELLYVTRIDRSGNTMYNGFDELNNFKLKRTPKKGR
jgi:hypothetical protein